ncbi:hypothetical protein PSTEL_17995 [Paenibacillus stellifer]|uniref:DUF4227 domain-containing protein n=1 Tax=Paenibacillus stellifer TaxID=169760 RepID=A0A089LZK6_9BACL|nr:DUF4227 family protein [Paenibacillus stellifer]AIQ64718.1 hypothetical protein PSTEL_17995 [Paenibacillus stellifer]
MSMVISLPKALRRLIFIVIFVAFTCLFYNIMDLLHRWMGPIPNPDIPEGSAVRAYTGVNPADGQMKASQRLKLYYWYGE